MARRMGLWLAVLAVIATVAAPAVLAVDVTFGKPTATAKWGDQVAFVQPAQLGGVPKRVEILLEFPGGLGPQIIEVAPPTAAGAVTLRYAILLAQGHLLPNTTITTRWRVTGQDGSSVVGPPVTVLYEDTRFEWKTREGALVRVHWYKGTDAFGDRALKVAETAIRETSQLLGVTEDKPVDFFVYANKNEFYDALGPGTHENVGGQANTELRTLYALITPAQINEAWVEIVIPHELSHLVFNTAVDNPYHFPPLWLNEGLAVYLSQGYDVGDRLAVEGAAQDGTLMPLNALTGHFPTTYDRFSLAYSEGASAVDYLVRVHGRDTLVSLIKSYTAGMTDDEAFKAALGVDVAGFDAAWRQELKAREPTVYGPKPAPAGPLPPGWSDAEGSPAPSLPPGAPSTAPGASPGGGPTTGPGTPTALDRPLVAMLAGMALVALAAIAVIVVSGRRRRPPPVG
ncbi:MAG: peptidase MA family metallohydrolase [Chloroflexota bacterium]|nr:peptidase MA family metallohydrolase [Chloroflexota bacterium]